MITGFENAHNMYHVDRAMQLLNIPEGIVLPQLKTTAEMPRWGLGGVCTKDNCFVELSAYDGGWASHGGFYEWDEEEYRDEDVVYFGMYFNHWGHFLIDLLGRLWPFVGETSPCKGMKVAYLGDEDPCGNFLEFFSLLGIEERDLIRITKPTRFRNVMVPEFCCKSCEWYSDEYRSIFDAMARQIEKEGFVPSTLPDIEKVYLTRSAFGKARGTEYGEDKIVEWMTANGFTVLAPEKLSVREQIYLWNHAKEIVCLDGSIPMNVAFCANENLRLTILHKTHLEHLNIELYLLMRPCEVQFLDTWYEPFKKYPEGIGSGPFIFDLSRDAEAYSQQRGWVFPFTDKELQKARRKNRTRMVWGIINLKGRARMAMSKIVPQKLKDIMRRGCDNV